MFHSHSSHRITPHRECSRQRLYRLRRWIAKAQGQRKSCGQWHCAGPQFKSLSTLCENNIYSTYSSKIYTFSLYHIQISPWNIIHHMINNCPPSFDYISDIITTHGICIYIYVCEMKFPCWEVSRSGFGLILSWAGGDGGLHLRKSLKDSPWNGAKILKFSGSQIDII